MRSQKALQLSSQIPRMVDIPSNITLDGCMSPQEFTTASDFFTCFWLFFKADLQVNVLLALMIFFTVFLNLLVMFLLVRRRPASKVTIFDRLIFFHCICDALTGLFDAPFYDIIQIFGYWPLSPLWGHIWAAYDSGICTVNNTSMLYLTYVRMRSIQAPNSFQKEKLIRRPLLIVLSYWILGYLIWIPLTFGFGSTQYSASINFQPYYVQFIVDFLFYFIPLASLISIGFYLIVLFQKRKSRQNKHTRIAKLARILRVETLPNGSSTTMSSLEPNSRKKFLNFIRSFRLSLGPQARFQIIVISYWSQWICSYLIDIFNPFCNCVPDNLSQVIYWLTYTVSMTDPISYSCSIQTLESLI